MIKRLSLAVILFIGITSSLMAQIPNYVPANGLVGWWPFTGNTNDAGWNGINGTPHNVTLAADRFGVINSAYAFNGTNGYIDLGNNPHLDFSLTDDVTFSFWFKTDSSGCQLFYNKRDNYTGIEVVACNDTIFPYYGSTFQSYVWEQASTDHFTDGNWHHLVVIYDQSAHTISTYIDNVIQSNTLGTSSVTGSINNSKAATFGSNLVGPDYEYFNGVLDDIGIWNRVLTPSEISALYHGNICVQNIAVTDTLLINIDFTGFNPVTYANTIKVWPNPANDHITIDNGNLSAVAGYQMKIENSLGQQIFLSAINQQQFYLDLATWTGNGIYFIHIIDAQGNTIDVKKIVLQ